MMAVFTKPLAERGGLCPLCRIAGVGLVAEIAQAELRMESGVPVAGLVVRATKPGAPGVNHA